MNPLFLLLLTPLLYGFTFSPMSQSIDLGDKQKGTQFLLENDGTENLAIELTAKERKMDETGEESVVETKEIAVFPPQLIIPPKEKRTIRVTYSGPVDLTQEKSFRVIAEQLGLKVDEKTKNRSGITMLMKYVAALYVTPENAKSGVSVESYKTTGKELILTVVNNGNRHQIMGDPNITFEKDSKKIMLKPADLKGFAGENVLAKSRRIFRIKSSVMIPSESKVTIKVND